LKNGALLDRVANHKKVYFASSWANYDLARQGTLKLVPPEHVMNDLQNDYRQMQPMFFREIPGWEEVIEAIREFEMEFNLG
jgi:hypothetical protein